MKRWFEREWLLTPIFWRIILVALTALLIRRYASAAFHALSLGDFDSFTSLAVYGLGMTLGRVWWPFGIAAAARRRSRSFGWWLFFSLVLSPLIVGLVYLAVKSDPIPARKFDSVPLSAGRAGKLRLRAIEILVENDSPAQAAPLLRKAADLGDAAAQFLIGSLYTLGRGVPQNLAIGAEWLYKAAIQGYPEAQFSLAGLYMAGTGVPKDSSVAVHWLHVAAQQGYAEAQHSLGYAYATGQGVAKDPIEAARWYRAAAEQGQGDAQNDLGVLYATGVGVELDAGRAETLLSAPAAEGSFEAKSNLVRIAAATEEKKDDLSDYLKAANAGDSDAQSMLGAFYDGGVGVPMDAREAARWYRRAAEQGHSYAQHNLGLLYKAGRGVSQSNAEAFYWLYISCSGKLDRFQAHYQKECDAVGLTVPPAEREEAIREAERWLKVHSRPAITAADQAD
jgi:TPR repeat protein